MWASQLSAAPKNLNDQQKKSQLETRKNLIFWSLAYIITAIIMTNIIEILLLKHKMPIIRILFSSHLCLKAEVN